MFANQPSSQQTPSKYNYSTFNLLEKCIHPEVVIHKNSMKNCLKCGIHISNDPTCVSYKSYKQNYKSFMDIQAFSKSIFDQKSKSISVKEDNPYRKNRPYLIDWMFTISEKLKFSFNTIHLAIFYLDFFLSTENIPSYQHQLYSLTSIFIAAKAIELDERIPFISKLLNAASNLFKQDEIRRAEHVLLDFFDWDLQIPTLIDMLEFYLSQGVVFSNDELDLYRGEKIIEPLNPLKEKNSNNLDESSKYLKKEGLNDNSLIKIVEKELNNLMMGQNNYNNEGNPENQNQIQRMVSLKILKEESLYYIVKEIENQIYRLSNHILRDLSLLEFEPKVLAAACIAFLRKISYISPIWNDDLKTISGGVDFENLKNVYLLILNKYEKIFVQKQELFEQPPIIASKISLKLEPPKTFNAVNHTYDVSRYSSQNQNIIKPAMSLNENKNNAVNYKNYSVAAFNSVNTIQSKHYNYPKSSSSILAVGQYNYIRYPSNNNL